MKQFAQMLVTLVTALAVVPVNHAWADYDAGVTAYQSGDFRTAMAEWLPLAEAGDAVSQNSVGALYDHGLGVDENDGEAALWYQRAADQGLPLAMRNLAGMYAGGYGLPYDKDQAVYWYEKAAEAGDEKSAQRLAALDPSRAVATPTPEPAPAAEPMTVAGDVGATTIAEESAPADTAVAADATTASPEPIAAAPSGEDDVQYGEAPAAAAPVASTEATSTEATTQQASLAMPAPVAGNWLIGQWEGPSLGCPPGGGLEFAATETRSYFGGKVAATLSASYTASGDQITVVTTGVDGVGHTYEYRRTTPDRFVIAAVPPEMPASMVGVEYRRCGPAPQPAVQPAVQSAEVAAAATPEAPAAAPTPQPAEFAEAEAQPAPVPEPAPESAAQPQASSAISVPTTPTNTTGAQSAAKLPAAPGTGGASAQAGWDAFGRGDYQGALDVWTPLAEAGDVNMQMLVGSIHDFGQGVPQDDAEAAKWYEMAAKQGSAKAQYQLGALYTRSPQVKNPVQGYTWLTIAAKTIGSGNVAGITADQATTLRALAAMSMSDAEVAEAEAAAKAFALKP